MSKDKNEILQEVIKVEEECGSIIDAIITICEKYQIEIETLAQYIKHSKELKERIAQEGKFLKMLK